MSSYSIDVAGAPYLVITCDQPGITDTIRNRSEPRHNLCSTCAGGVKILIKPL